MGAFPQPDRTEPSPSVDSWTVAGGAGRRGAAWEEGAAKELDFTATYWWPYGRPI